MSEDSETSRAAGCAAVAVLGSVAAGTVFAVSPATGVLAVWTLGAWMVWRGVSRGPNKIDNHSPPPPERVVVNKNTQVKAWANGAAYTVYPAGERVRVTRKRDES